MKSLYSPPPGSGQLDIARRSAWFSVFALTLAYTVSYVDRQLPSLLIEYIKKDLRIDDVEVSLLAGSAFALFYTTAAIPISRLADIWQRKGVILLGVMIWGVMTCLCGLATSFGAFFVARTGVGLGEAALTPSAYALVTEFFPPQRQGRAMSFFTIGAPLGGGLSFVIGAIAIGAAKKFGNVYIPGHGPLPVWGSVLFGVGLVTLLTLVPLAAIREPRRAQVQTTVHEAGRPSFVESLRMLWRLRRGLAPLCLATPLISLASYGLSAWGPSYFIRSYGWTIERTGILLGLALVPAGIVGTLAGGALSDYLRSRRQLDAPLLVMAAGAAAVLPLAIAFPFLHSWMLALADILLTMMIVSPVAALAPVALQSVVSPDIRAQASAWFLLIVNVIGIGFGPLCVAWVNQYVMRNPNALGASIGLVGAVSFSLAAIAFYSGRGAFKRALAPDSITPAT